MDRTTTQYNFTEGTDVVGSDGDKVGEIVAVHPNYLVVEKGFFFPTDYYIPTSAVSTYDGDKVYLGVTKDEALNQGWDTAPTEDSYAAGSYDTTDSYATTTTATTGAAMDYADSSTVGTADYVDTSAGTGRMAATATGTADYGTSTRVEGDDTLRVQVHEEDLTATTRQREIGEVQITKDVIEEQRVLEVPVTEERVRVQRHVVDRAVDAGGDTFQSGTIEVPIRGEEVQLQKEVRVTEEIEIGKEAVQRTEQVGGTVRREVVDVSETAIPTGVTTTTTGTTTTGSRASMGSRDAGFFDDSDADRGGLVDEVKDAVRGDRDSSR